MTAMTEMCLTSLSSLQLCWPKVELIECEVARQVTKPPTVTLRLRDLVRADR